LDINDRPNLSFEKRFQNKTLRPIIKLQHDLLTLHFQEYLLKMNHNFEVLSNPEKQDCLFSAFNRDNSFKLELKGIIIGHFTKDEFTDYGCNKNNFNKRILTMNKERLISVLI
jgi:hypothetical protein